MDKLLKLAEALEQQIGVNTASKKQAARRKTTLGEYKRVLAHALAMIEEGQWWIGEHDRIVNMLERSLARMKHMCMAGNTFSGHWGCTQAIDRVEEVADMIEDNVKKRKKASVDLTLTHLDRGGLPSR